MIRQNLHTHTVFDDGKNTPREMAQAALEAGLSSLGFSVHSTLPWENDWCLRPERLVEYLDAVRRTREEFQGRLDIYSGIEWDALSDQDPTGFDYVIGSLHHIAVKNEPCAIDESPRETGRVLEQVFHGDRDAMAEAYFAQYTALAENPAVDIVGHFDLLTKFSERNADLPGDTPVFRDCAMAALEPLAAAGKLFEVNTGAIARGWRTVPYPAPWLLRELRARNARVLISADAHSADAVCCVFQDMEALLRELGFREIWHLSPSGFQPVRL